MHASTITPSIEVTIGRETRLYHAFITTAPPTARRTGHGHVAHGAALGRVRHGGGSDRIRSHAREVIRHGLCWSTRTELDWQRARYREERHLFAPADPVLVGLNTLQHWLWNRIGSPATDLELANA